MKPHFLIVDLFCGAGGTTTGFDMARMDGKKICKVIACVNHDPIAIASHSANHKGVHHFTEDIRTLNVSLLVKLLREQRAKYPDALVILWASLECTNFSKAKGGLPRDADSRTLAQQLYRYVKALSPDYVMIENVEEFMSWGPLDHDGKPISRKNGVDYMKWVEHLRSFGYDYDFRMLNSADYGAYTSRKRYFGIFARYTLPLIFPEPTHAKNVLPKQEKSQKGFFGDFKTLKKWNAVREVLDLEDKGRSIFERAKPLSEKTLARIHAGLIKFVAGGKDAFLLKYNSTSKNGKHVPPGIEEPCPTVATQNRLGITFISKYYSGRPQHKNIDIEGPAGTIKTIDGQALVNAEFLLNYHHSSDADTTNKPVGALTTKDKRAIIKPEFLLKYYGTGVCQPIDKPADALSTKDRFALVKPQFIMRDFTNGGNLQSIDDPSGSILPFPKSNLVSAEPFIVDPSFGNKPYDVNGPAKTLLASRKHQYIVNPQWGIQTSSIDNPAPVIIARQDKTPLQFVTAIGSEHPIAIAIYQDDSEMTVKIKEFMALYEIVDIKMRMLKIPELKRIQGFPDDYVLHGSQSHQKKFIGNAVVPLVVKAMAEAIDEKLFTNENVKVA